MKTIVISLFSLIPLVPLVLMFVSAHNGNIAYTCAMGFMAIYLCYFSFLHDINVTLYRIWSVLKEIAYEEGEDERED